MKINYWEIAKGATLAAITAIVTYLFNYFSVPIPPDFPLVVQQQVAHEVAAQSAVVAGSTVGVLWIIFQIIVKLFIANEPAR